MTDVKEKSNKKILTGVVISTKMQDTAVVEVIRYSKHNKYDKFIKRKKKYHIHDEGNTVKEGDKVSMIECAPISKKKHFKLIKE